MNPLNGFTGSVALSHGPVPSGLTCQAFIPATLTSSVAQSSLSCTSTVAGSYPVTVTGTSGTLIHTTIAVFTFTSTTSPDFRVSAHTPVTFASGSTATSSITVAALAGFYYLVALSSSVSPSTGLSVSLNPQSIVYGSGTSTATFSSSTPGSYRVTITGTYGSLVHTAAVQVTVTAPGTSTPDISLSTDHSSLSFSSGTSGTAAITVAPQNGFSGSITLDVTAPTGVSCSLSSTNIHTSGTSTLTCNSSTEGDYTVTVRATGGASPHTTTVNVHVAGVSPAAPAPSTILGLAPALFYGIIAVIIIVAGAGMVLILRSRGSKP